MTQRWQALQLSPLSACLRDVPWQARQTMVGVCQAGLGGARAWPGVSLWQTAQLPLEASGTWQLVQWRSRGAFHPAVCDTGDVDWWHRTHESLAWHVWQRDRSIPAAIPWALMRQKSLWSAGG